MKVLVDGLSRETGGVGSLIMNITSYALSVQGPVAFSFLVSEDSVYIPELKEKGLQYFLVPKLTRVLEYRSCLSKLFRQNHFDYVWINNSSKVNLLLPRMAVKLGKAKVIAHTHGISSEETGLKAAVFQGIEHCVQKKFDAYISIPLACSQAAADHFYSDPELRSRVQLIHNGIFAEKFLFSPEVRQETRSRLLIEDTDILLGAVGRMAPVKNYLFLIPLLKALPPEYKLLFLGDGPDREDIENAADAAGVKSRILMPGCVPNVAAYLNAMDVFVMPSLHEGMPFSAIEAQACGLPCVISDTVTKDVDLTASVRFARLNDTQDWQEKVIAAAQSPVDRMEMNQKVTAAGFSIENGYRTLLQVMEDHKVEN